MKLQGLPLARRQGTQKKRRRELKKNWEAPSSMEVAFVFSLGKE